jgi:hypothetical protein
MKILDIFPYLQQTPRKKRQIKTGEIGQESQVGKSIFQAIDTAPIPLRNHGFRVITKNARREDSEEIADPMFRTFPPDRRGKTTGRATTNR